MASDDELAARFQAIFLHPDEPLDAERRQLASRLLRGHSSHPFDHGALEARRLMLIWMIETPHVHVAICATFTRLFAEDDAGSSRVMDHAAQSNDVPSVMFAAYVLGMTAFLVEHPEAAPDGEEAQLEGMRSMLRVYAIARDTRRLAPEPYFEERLADDQRGELGIWYRAHAQCAMQEGIPQAM
jgi:hypothetical protein